MRFPISWQVAARQCVPLAAWIRMLLFVLFDQRFPLRLLLRATVDRFTKVSQRLIGYIELFIFGPTEVPFGFPHRFLTGSVAVCLARAGGGHAVTDYRLDGNQRGLICNFLRGTNRLINCFKIVTVKHCRRVPTVSFESPGYIFRKSERGKTFDRYVIVVVEI